MKFLFYLLLITNLVGHSFISNAGSFFKKKSPCSPQNSKIYLDLLFVHWVSIPSIKENISHILNHTKQRLEYIYAKNLNLKVKLRLKRMIYTLEEFIHVFDYGYYTKLPLTSVKTLPSLTLNNYSADTSHLFNNINLANNLLAALKLVSLKDEGIALNYKRLLIPKDALEAQKDQFTFLDEFFEEQQEQVLNIYYNLSFFLRVLKSRISFYIVH